MKAVTAYRFFDAPQIPRDTLLGPTPLTIDADGQNQSISAVLTFEFQ